MRRFREERQFHQLTHITACVEYSAYFVKISAQIHYDGEGPVFVVRLAPSFRVDVFHQTGTRQPNYVIGVEENCLGNFAKIVKWEEYFRKILVVCQSRSM